MGFKETGRYCPYCRRNVLARQETPNHVLHFLIAFFTCGLWLIVWLLLTAMQDPWRCPTCGQNTLPDEAAANAPAVEPRRALTPAEVARSRAVDKRAIVIILSVVGALVLIMAIALFVAWRAMAERGSLPRSEILTVA